MSRIDELLAQHCPDGIEVKMLGEVTEVRSGLGFPAADQGAVDGTYPFYKVSDMNLPGNALEMSRANNYVDEATARRLGVSPAPAGTVIFPKIGAAVATNKKRLLSMTSVFDNNVMGLIPGPEIIPRFLLFWMQTLDLTRVSNDSGAVPSIRKSVMQFVRVPVPPLEVQREIVRILGQFTQLEAELEAELEARRRQYDYFRDSLLTFPDHSDVRWSTLGEVSIRVASGATPLSGRPEYYNEGTIPWLRTQEVRFVDIWDTEIRITEKALKETSTKWIPANCVIVAISGATAGRSAINRIPLTTNQHCCNLEIDPDKANFRYVFYWVRSQYQHMKALGQGARSDLNAGIIKSVKIPLPPLPEQERIVSILDKFDALVNDFSVGLPAELAARRKQYEYYRDRLLTFEEKAGA